MAIDGVFKVAPRWYNTGGDCMVQLMEFTADFQKKLGLQFPTFAVCNELASLHASVAGFHEDSYATKYLPNSMGKHRP